MTGCKAIRPAAGSLVSVPRILFAACKTGDLPKVGFVRTCAPRGTAACNVRAKTSGRLPSSSHSFPTRRLPMKPVVSVMKYRTLFPSLPVARPRRS